MRHNLLIGLDNDIHYTIGEYITIVEARAISNGGCSSVSYVIRFTFIVSLTVFNVGKDKCT